MNEPLIDNSELLTQQSNLSWDLLIRVIIRVLPETIVMLAQESQGQDKYFRDYSKSLILKKENYPFWSGSRNGGKGGIGKKCPRKSGTRTHSQLPDRISSIELHNINNINLIENITPFIPFFKYF